MGNSPKVLRSVLVACLILFFPAPFVYAGGNSNDTNSGKKSLTVLMIRRKVLFAL